MFFKKFNPFQFNSMIDRIVELENKVYELERVIEENKKLNQTKLLRIKNGDQLANSFVTSEMGYQDLSPSKAYKLYQEHDKNFVVLDVSDKNFQPHNHIEEAVQIELEALEYQVPFEVPSKTTPIFVISEDGVKSVLACQMLYALGYFNVNNISGGHKFWPGNRSGRVQQTTKLSA